MNQNDALIALCRALLEGSEDDRTARLGKAHHHR